MARLDGWRGRALATAGLVLGLGALLSGAIGQLEEDTVAVIRAGAGAAPAPPAALRREAWEAFRLATRDARAAVAAEARAAGRAQARAAVETAVAAMRAEIPAFADWRFSFFTTYRLTFTGLGAALTGGQAGEAVQAALAERFAALVLKPDTVRRALGTAIDEVAEEGSRRRAAFVAERRDTLDRLVADARPGPRVAAAMPAVAESEALGLPTPGPRRTEVALPAADGEVGWFGRGEALVFAGRQALRRGVGSAAEPFVLAALPAGLFETVPLVAGPLLGGALFAAGLGSEFVAVKLWEAEERAGLEEAAGRALDLYRDALLAQATAAADEVTAAAVGAP